MGLLGDITSRLYDRTDEEPKMVQHVIAIRIYLGVNNEPMADLKMSDGVCETIAWTDYKQRKEFERRISGYTLIYDERPKCRWDEL